jgi:hypothetical protein
MSQRIKGQEVEVVMIVDGQPRDNLNFARSLEFTYKTELKSEGYLGETSKRYDTIFNGIEGALNFHFDSPEIFNIIRFIVDKARRRIPGTRFNIKSTFNYPSGTRARILIPDCEFGELPIKFGSREDYGEFNLPIGATEARVLPI